MHIQKIRNEIDQNMKTYLQKHHWKQWERETQKHRYDKNIYFQ